MAKAVEMRKVDSSMFSEVGYSEDSWVLTVIYRSSGLRLDYQQIPPEMFDEMMAAPSLGRFFNDQIKGRYSAIGADVAQQAGDPELTEIDEDIRMVSPGWNGREIVPTDGIPADAPVPPHVWPTYGGIDRSQTSADFGVREFDPQTGHRPNSEVNEDGTVKGAALTKQTEGEILAAWVAPTTPVEAITMLDDRRPEIEALVKSNEADAKTALVIQVKDGPSHAKAAQVLASFVVTKDKHFALLDPFRAILYKTYNEASELKNRALAPLDQAINHLKRTMGTWEQEQERIRQQRIREERERAEAAARDLQKQQSEQLTLAEVQDALEQGDTQKAEELIQNPIETPLPYVPTRQVEPTYLPPEGQSTRPNWKVDEDSINMVEFLEAVKSGKYPVDKAARVIKPDLPALNKLAKALTTAFDVPGFRAWNDPVRSVRRGK